MNLPTLSIVVPHFNHIQYLPTCLSSIFNQQIQSFEVIVIDDASNDNSAAQLALLQKQYNFQIIQNTQNLGVIAVINQGLKIAAGEFILILAADDWILPGMLLESLGLLAKFPNAAFCSGLSLQLIGNATAPTFLPTPLPLKEAGYIDPKRVHKELLWDDSWFMGNTVILNRVKALNEGGFLKELSSFCDNFLYGCLALKYGCCFIPKPLGVWRRSNTSYSSSTLSNIELLNSINTRVNFLMSQRKMLFSTKLINRWQSRWQYMIYSSILAGAALNNTQNGVAIDLKCLHKMAPFFQQKILGCFGKILANFYIFIRFRYFDIFPVFYRRMRWWLFLMNESKHKNAIFNFLRNIS